MTNSRVRDIFLAAIELEGSARDAHLAEACGRGRSNVAGCRAIVRGGQLGGLAASRLAS